MSLKPIEQYYQAFNKKDVHAILDLCTNDVENVPNNGDPQRGKDKLKLFLETAWAHFDEQVSDLVLMNDKNQEKIAVQYRVDGKYYHTKPGLFAATQQTYTVWPVTIFTVKNNQISKMERFYNTKHWLDQVNPEQK